MRVSRKELSKLINEVIEKVILESKSESEKLKTTTDDIDVDDLKDQIFNTQQTNTEIDTSDAPELSSSSGMSRRGFLKATGLAAGALAIGSNIMKQTIAGQSVSDLNNDLAAYMSILKKESGLSNDKLIESVRGVMGMGINYDRSPHYKKLVNVVKNSMREIGARLQGRNVTHTQMGEIVYGVLLPALQSTVVNDILPNIYDPIEAFAFAQAFYVSPSVENNTFLEWCAGLLSEILQSFGYSGKLLQVIKHLSNVDPNFQTEYLEQIKNSIAKNNERVDNAISLVSAIENSGVSQKIIEISEQRSAEFIGADFDKPRITIPLGEMISKDGNVYQATLVVNDKNTDYHYVHFFTTDIGNGYETSIGISDFKNGFARQKSYKKATLSQALSAINSGSPGSVEEVNSNTGIIDSLYDVDGFLEHANPMTIKNRGNEKFKISQEELEELDDLIVYRFNFHFLHNGDNLEEILDTIE
jgi:hypothetical protein